MNNGGIRAKQGYAFEAESLLNYLLLRMMAGEAVELTFERAQDATFVYPACAQHGEIVELVQSKKRTRPPPPSDREPILGWDPPLPPGPLYRGDLKAALAKPTGTDPIPKLLEDPRYRFTLLVFAEVAEAIKSFIPTGCATPAHFSDPSRVARLCPPDFTHGTDPDPTKIVGSLTAAGRVRILPTENPNRIDELSEKFLRHLGVPADASHRVFKALLERVEWLYKAHDEINRCLTSDEVGQAIARERNACGRWRPGAELLQEYSTLGGIGTETLRDADVFRNTLFWRHPYLREAESLLLDERRRMPRYGTSVVICGPSNSGKTTICKYVMHQFLELSGSQTYYLAVQPGTLLSQELEFFKRHLTTTALFIIDDEQYAEPLVRTFVEAYCRDRSKASLVVASTHTYSASQVSKDDHPLHTFPAIRMRDFGPEDLRPLFDANVPGLARLTVEQRTFISTSRMTGGKLGQAVSLGRFFSGQPAAAPSERVIDTRYARDVVRHWLKQELRCSSNEELQTQIIPLLALSSYFIPFPASYAAKYSERLVQLRILARSDGGKVVARDISVPRVVWRQNRDDFVSFIRDYLKDYSHELCAVSLRLIINGFGQGVLRTLLEIEEDLFIDRIRVVGLTDLTEFTILLQSMRIASRQRTRYLLRKAIGPLRRPNRAFIRQLFQFSGTHPIRTHGTLFQSLAGVDRDLANEILAETFRPAAVVPITEIVTRIIEKMDEPNVTLVDAFSFIATVYRCHAAFAKEIHHSFLGSEIYQRKLRTVLQSDDKMIELIRCCNMLSHFDHVTFKRYVDDFFAVKDVVNILRQSTTSGRIFVFLHQLHRVLPRSARDAVASLWLANPSWFHGILTRFDNLNVAVGFVRILATIHRRVGLSLADSKETFLCALASQERDPFQLADAVYRAHALSYRTAKALARTANAKSLADRIYAQRDHLAPVGGTLSTYANIWPPLLSAVLPALDLDVIYGQLDSYQFLPSFTALTLGFGNAMNACRTDGSGLPAQALIDRLKSNRQVSALLHEAMAAHETDRIPAVTLHQISLAFAALIAIRVRSDDFFELFGIRDAQDLLDRIRTWINGSVDLNEMRHFLAVTARLSSKSFALQTLHCVVAKLDLRPASETIDTRQPSTQIAPRDRINTDNFVEVGELLSIAGAIDEDVANRLSALFSAEDLAASGRRDQNLGRHVVLLHGLHATSRSKCLQVARMLYGEDALDFVKKAVGAGEHIDNVVQLIIVLRKIDPDAANRVLRTAIEQAREKILSSLDVETNLASFSRWLRSLGTEVGCSRDNFQAEVVLRLGDAAPYEERLFGFVEATLALYEIGEGNHTHRLLDGIARAADQAATIRSPAVLIDLILHLMQIDQLSGSANCTRQALAHVTPAMIERLMAGEDAFPVTAFLFYLFEHHVPDGHSNYRRVLDAGRNSLLARIRAQAASPSGVVAEILLDSDDLTIAERLAQLDPERLRQFRPWELGLIEVFYAAMRGFDGDTLLKGRDLVEGLDAKTQASFIESRQRYFSDEAINIKYALSLRSLPDMRAMAVAQDAVRRSAEERRLGEQRTVVRWLLDSAFLASGLATKPYYLKLILNETLLAVYAFDWVEDLADEVYAAVADRTGRATSETLGQKERAA